MEFEKWEACGNDFIVIEREVSAEVAERLCNRHYGIGADGVLEVLQSEEADCKMIVVNADGSVAEMCGNGIRCVGQYVSEKLGKPEVRVETGAGLKRVVIGEANERIRVQMGEAKLKWTKEVAVPGGRIVYRNASFVDMGNPHCVLIVDEEETQKGAIERYGRKIEKMTELFPEGTNVEYVVVQGGDRLRVRVWERGCGRTLACGTGACASAYAAYKQGLVSERVTVELDGGEVEVKLSAGVEMTGPAHRVYRGKIDLPGGV